MKKRVLSCILMICMLFSILVGCTGGVDDGKIVIEPGDWSISSHPDDIARWDNYISTFQKMYPDVTVKGGNTYSYNVTTFPMKAASKQLPTTLNVYFTEIKQMIADDMIADITDELEANGLLDKLNSDILELCTDENGRIYAFPTDAYAMGLVINRSLFEQAGLVNADGSVKIPETWEDLADYAKVIKKKTGKAGFAMATTNNQGGWQMMNIAWSYGVTFEEQQSDGSWKAVFNTQEFKDTLQYISDLKWKHGVLPADNLIDNEALVRMFATGQVAMALIPADNFNTMAVNYGMDIADICYAKMPAGPEGRYAQTGGSVSIFNKDATSEQIDATIKWLMFLGRNPEIDETVEANLRATWEPQAEAGCVLFPEPLLDVWDYAPRAERYKEIMKDYANFDMKNVESYMDFSDVVLKSEEPIACQQLYSVLDSVIQEIMTNRNADLGKLTEQAVKDFQSNYLDNLS